MHETDSKHKKRRVSAIASDYQAGGEVADDWEAWCLTVVYQCSYVRLLTFVHAHLFTFTKLAIHVSQAYRDAVIMVYTDKEEAWRCGIKDIEIARKVLEKYLGLNFLGLNFMPGAMICLISIVLG